MQFIKNAKYENNILKFDFTGSIRDANVLRKIFLGEIPVLALDTINIYENTTVLNHEELSRRLWLSPILNIGEKTLENMQYIERELLFDLEIRKKSGNVYTQDFRVLKASTFTSPNDDTKICLFPDIIITPISTEHTLEIRAIAKIGYGKDHAKWNTVSFTKFSEKKGSVRFELQSLGQYSPRELLACALRIFTEKKSTEITVEEDDSWLDDE